ncbi:LLM class flavin-dependent oxidoreductase [Pseudonocardia sp. RS010]|uniref:LLM class flavin-dependent oxidoreductase n=1 Tax=Pseudonocardia sp. RS010 TaxID=3385979 RepID=UPI0039A08875
MKFQLFMLPTIPATLEERAAKRPIGRDVDAFQAMIEEVRELAVIADQAGFDVFSTTEHHFHSEGFEASVQPMMLYADLAARTENIAFAPLSLVLPANDPLRVAEQVAYLDHLTQGRVYGGYARGYQDRWVNVFGQHVPVKGTPMDGSPDDKHNRAVHEEYLELIYKAWTDDLLTFDGEFYKVPPKEGITRWPAAEWTRRYGHPDEIDENGHIRGISVIPKPYQQPYPPAFQPFSVSESTMVHTAQHGVMPIILVAEPGQFTHLAKLYQSSAADAGRDLKLGENIGAFRAVAFGEDRQQAWNLMERTNYYGFQIYFSGFGFWEALRLPGDEQTYPKGSALLPPEEWTMERFTKTKYGLAGTVDDIKRDVEDLATIHGNGGELEWFSWFFDQGLMPVDEAKRQLEIFAEHIIPEFR